MSESQKSNPAPAPPKKTKSVAPGGRLAEIISRVPLGASVLDLGADHGYVPIALVRRGETQVYASDVAEKPLARAKANAARRGVAGAITFLLADGVPGELRGKIGYVIIAGMGGESIAAILGAAPWVKSDGVKLILQPQSKRDFLRGWLRDNGYEIQCDSGITDGGRKYYIWSVE